MAWFGHTQTLTSISKSVTTVASGILGLEDNLATFMKKVIYYDRFFQRVRANLPKEVASTAALLFARCYEYRDEIRDELESSLAYVADAGRWVVGMEDWNSKMDKRAHQINELVLLANSLLAEYAMSGRLGSDGAKDELDAYLRTIATSVVLRNHKPPAAAAAAAAAATAAAIAISPAATAPTSSTSSSPSSLGSSRLQQTTAATVGNSSSTDSASVESLDCPPLEPHTGSDVDYRDSDNDAFNPFAPRVAATPQHSIASSLASLASASTPSSSVLDLATNDIERDLRRIDTTDDSVADNAADQDSHAPDSPVDIGDYECLDLASIPKYSAFKPAIRSHQQRLTAAATATTAAAGYNVPMTRSVDSLATRINSNELERPHTSDHISNSFPSLRQRHHDGRVATYSRERRQPHRLADLSCSYDFQREQANNPFASPPAIALAPPLLSVVANDTFALASGVSVESSEPPAPASATQQIADDSDSYDGDHDAESDATNALIAAIAAAAEDDDYDLFGHAT